MDFDSDSSTFPLEPFELAAFDYIAGIAGDLLLFSFFLFVISFYFCVIRVSSLLAFFKKWPQTVSLLSLYKDIFFFISPWNNREKESYCHVLDIIDHSNLITSSAPTGPKRDAQLNQY